MAHLTSVKNTNVSWDKIETHVFAVGIFEDKLLSDTGKAIDTVLNGQISKALDSGAIKGKSGETTSFYTEKKQIIVVGLGKKDDYKEETLRLAAGTVSKYGISHKLASVAMEVFGGNSSSDYCQALAEGAVLGSYQFLEYKTTEKDIVELESATVLNGDENGLNKGTIIANGVCYARNIENRPGNYSTPSALAASAEEIGKEGNINVTIFDRDQFTEMGMGGLAGVALGTDEPPKFIIMEYFGASEDEKPVVLVGKGLTFDSGGISLKPAERMDEMKYDMCGSGVVFGVMKAIASLKPKMNIVSIIPSTENMGGAKAMKPGDILTAYNGKTIEVLNTDAEGRLILADGLAYASKHYDPEYILDFATLTGAVLVALGHVATGIMGTDEALIEKVKASSKVTGEKVWEFPLWDEFCEHVKSDIADVKNTGAPRQAGTIAGGAFLKEFVDENIPWVHFDIAGTAWGVKEKPYTPKKGASGEVIRLVLDMLNV